MKKFKRETLKDDFIPFVREDAKNGGGKYIMMIDNRDGNLVLMSRASKAKYYTRIGKVKTSLSKLTLRNVNKVASEMRNNLIAYNKRTFVCYSRAVSEYGKRNVVDKAFIKYVENPHYHCAPYMRLYDRNVIEYYMNNK